MTELVVCSGKGGTGKTSVVAGLAALADGLLLADADVDAANLHLVLSPVRERTTPFEAGHTARIRSRVCAGCGTCQALCRFGAVAHRNAPAGGRVFTVDPLLCEGCGVCVHFCPEGAIEFVSRTCGELLISRTPHGPLVHAALAVGAENSGKLVSLVRAEARRLAAALTLDLILVDGPPGIGCPASAALTGADLTLLVTEPSQSALHDLHRAADLAAHFDVPAVVCINKHDLSPRLTGIIEDECRERDLPVVGRIPFDARVNAAQAAGRSLVELAPRGEAAAALAATWRRVQRRLNREPLAKG
jgi:MinD superfamily P-loop ATPase